MRDNKGRFIKGFSGFNGKHSEETKKKISTTKKINGDRPPEKFLTGEHMRGSKHWNWKGGIRGLDYLERRKFQKTIQKQIFERDGYKCVLCGNGGNLQVDHIQPWAEYVELRFSFDNCRTLCAECHYKITFNKPMPKNIKGWGQNILQGGELK